MSATDPQRTRHHRARQWQHFARSKADNLRLAALALGAFALMALLNPGLFLSHANLESMAFQFPELALLSLAMMLAMLTGGIDLAVVSIANLSGILAALVLTRFLPADAGAAQTTVVLVGAGLVAVACGGCCGAVNGLLIARVRIPPILATLGTMQLFAGLALVFSGGRAVFGYPDRFLFLGNGTLLGIPVPFLLFVVAAVAVAVLSRHTAWGIQMRLLGTNPKAAYFAGIRVRSVLLRTYLSTGLIAGLTGLLMIARTNSAKADYGSAYLLQAILVVVLGGVNPAGGFGTVLGVTTAVLALQFLASGFNMLHFSNFAKEFVWGAFLLLSIVLNQYAKRRESAAGFECGSGASVLGVGRRPE